MRPDEFNRQCAMDWIEAVTLRSALEEGRRRAHDEQQAMRELDRLASGS